MVEGKEEKEEKEEEGGKNVFFVGVIALSQSSVQTGERL